MALHTFFFTAPEELARPPVGLEFKDLPTHQVRGEGAGTARYEPTECTDELAECSLSLELVGPAVSTTCGPWWHCARPIFNASVQHWSTHTLPLPIFIFVRYCPERCFIPAPLGPSRPVHPLVPPPAAPPPPSCPQAGLDEAPEARQRRASACQSAMDSVFAGCDSRCREQLTLDEHVGCVFERSVSRGEEGGV